MRARENYRAALLRMIEVKLQNVPKGPAMNKNTVALEAGRGRGLIKKSRAEHAEFFVAIEAAAAPQQAISRPTVAEEVEKHRLIKMQAEERLRSLRIDYLITC